MATTKARLESLVNNEEIVYWARKNSITLEEFPGGFYVDEWQINLNEAGAITSVERRLDEPTQL